MSDETPNVLTECWVWKGARGGKGYGSKMIRGKAYRTHRLAWEWVNGPIPDGMMVLHRCDNPPCCNPNHLFIGTNTDNMRDMVAKGRGSFPTHCPNGHEFTKENSRASPTKIQPNRRYCLTCRRVLWKKYNLERVANNPNYWSEDYARRRRAKQKNQ